MKHPRIGNIVHIKFLDHTRYSGYRGPDAVNLMNIECYGKIIGISRQAIEIGSWITKEEDDRSNDECFSILRAAIVSMRVLK